MKKEEFEKVNVFGLGESNEAYAKYYIGESYLKPLTKASDGIFLANVTFEPRCRNNWHIHHSTRGGGQVLIWYCWLWMVSNCWRRSKKIITWRCSSDTCEC